MAELCHEASSLDADFAVLGKEVGYLDRYYIPTRYPDGLPGGIPANALRKSDAEEALAGAERVVKMVAKKIGPSS